MSDEEEKRKTGKQCQNYSCFQLRSVKQEPEAEPATELYQ